MHTAYIASEARPCQEYGNLDSNPICWRFDGLERGPDGTNPFKCDSNVAVLFEFHGIEFAESSMYNAARHFAELGEWHPAASF